MLVKKSSTISLKCHARVVSIYAHTKEGLRMNTDNAKSEQVELNFLLKWLLICTVGWIVIIAIGLVSTSPTGPSGLGRWWYIKDGLIQLVMFVPGGVIVGILQWFALRGKLTQLGSWAVALIWVWLAFMSYTLGFFAISWLGLTMMVESSYMEVPNAVFTAAIAGLALTGFPQWFVLRRYLSKISWWLIIVPVGIFFSYAANCVGRFLYYDTSLDNVSGAINGVLGGLVYGLFSAMALSLFFRSQSSKSTNSEQDDN